ncbi:hypothetical protein LCGC14_0994660 [marine sediment metagenome]|uniref:Uncharacterized protein n=1 Tax=marine sediment metagenome TaxID=412755 RepID=A0A0F9QN75_9ZZZZ
MNKLGGYPGIDVPAREVVNAILRPKTDVLKDKKFQFFYTNSEC